MKPNHSYADLEQIQAVHKTYVKRLTPEQHVRLNANRTRELQRHITKFFGRPNSFDSRADKAPSKGTYLCVNCFFTSMLAYRRRTANKRLRSKAAPCVMARRG
jgi:hypothetical protein